MAPEIIFQRLNISDTHPVCAYGWTTSSKGGPETFLDKWG